MNDLSGKLNEFCKLANLGFCGFNLNGTLENSGKVIPYIGWHWRYVDFNNRELPLGYCVGGLFCGFMVKNK